MFNDSIVTTAMSIINEKSKVELVATTGQCNVDGTQML